MKTLLTTAMALLAYSGATAATQALGNSQPADDLERAADRLAEKADRIREAVPIDPKSPGDLAFVARYQGDVTKRDVELIIFDSKTQRVTMRAKDFFSIHDSGTVWVINRYYPTRRLAGSQLKAKLRFDCNLETSITEAVWLKVDNREPHYSAEASPSVPIVPGTIGEAELRAACAN